VITNILVKAMTQFPSAQFDLAMHLLPQSLTRPSPSASSGGKHDSELAEAVHKLRELNCLLERSEYARFWATLDSDDLYADLTTDISGFEDTVRVRIAQIISQSAREIAVSVLEARLGLSSEQEAVTFAVETCGWSVGEDGIVQIPRNADNEAKKADVREDVNVDMFARVIRRSWEEVA
jgi:translation initiation factor 3 subunit K